MKYIMKSAMSVMMIAFFAITTNANAQTANDNGKQYVEIKTSVVCGSCKKTVETALSKVDGVESAKVDVDSKIAKVEYDGSKTNVDAIKKAITEAGYDADDMPANADAYDHLDGCCKKD